METRLAEKEVRSILNSNLPRDYMVIFSQLEVLHAVDQHCGSYSIFRFVFFIFSIASFKLGFVVL